MGPTWLRRWRQTPSTYTRGTAQSTCLCTSRSIRRERSSTLSDTTRKSRRKCINFAEREREKGQGDLDTADAVTAVRFLLPSLLGPFPLPPAAEYKLGKSFDTGKDIKYVCWLRCLKLWPLLFPYLPTGETTPRRRRRMGRNAISNTLYTRSKREMCTVLHRKGQTL